MLLRLNTCCKIVFRAIVSTSNSNYEIKMGAPLVNEHLLNSFLAGFLISSLPVEEQLIPRQWLHRLHPIPKKCEGIFAEGSPECEEEQQKRDYLLRNFLYGLLKADLPDVFSEPPPPGPLPQSEDIVPRLRGPSVQWAIDLEKTDVPENSQLPSSIKFSTPSEFLSVQPTPCNGAFCYGAVFSELLPKVSSSKN